MTFRLSTPVRNAMLDSVESTIGTSPRLRIYDGAEPANPAAAPAGTVLVDMTCPSDWAAAASGGAKAFLGTWQVNAGSSGVATYFRIWDSAVSVCHIQGSCTATGGGGDMILDNVNIVAGQQVTVTAFTITDGNG